MMTIVKRFSIVIVILILTISCARHKTQFLENNESSLPSLYLTIDPLQLDSILNDQDLKIPAEALLVTPQHDTLFNEELSYIKTRGNSTFKEIKKPFTVKFHRKQKLLGLNKSRSFVLLANAHDESHIRNAIALDLAHAIGLPAPNYTYISLYINNEYKGLYQMTNKVEVGRHVLNITDLDELNKQANPQRLEEYDLFRYANEYKGVMLEYDPEDITGGYLLENINVIHEYYNKSKSGFISNIGDRIRIRSPKHASVNEVEYIANLYNLMEAAVISEDGCNPVTGKHYSEYIDVKSFALYYLLNEVLLNMDGGFVSFFMYKDSDFYDSKIYAGPIWDFDLTLGSPRFNTNIIAPNEIYIGSKICYIRDHDTSSDGLLYNLMQHKDFQIIVKQLYLNEISPILHDYLADGNIEDLSKALYFEAEKDNQLYQYRYSSNYYMAIKTVKDFLNSRLEFFDWYYSTPENDMVTVDYTNKDKAPHRREIHIYYPINEPIFPPSLKATTTIYNHTPIPTLYYAGTDCIVPNGKIFNAPQHLELREREPTKIEILKRRIKKKFVNWGINI